MVINVFAIRPLLDFRSYPNRCYGNRYAIDQAVRRIGRRPCPYDHCVFSGLCLCDGFLVCATFDDNVIAVEW
jgi:hypothetical protein